METIENIQDKPFVMTTTNMETGETVQTFLSPNEVRLLLPTVPTSEMDAVMKSMQRDYPEHYIVPTEAMQRVEKMLRPSPLKRLNIFNLFRSN